MASDSRSHSFPLSTMAGRLVCRAMPILFSLNPIFALVPHGRRAGLAIQPYPEKRGSSAIPAGPGIPLDDFLDLEVC